MTGVVLLLEIAQSSHGAFAMHPHVNIFGVYILHSCL